MKPPVAPKHEKQLVLHGDTRTDDYFWLKNKGAPQVLEYLNAENTYADAWMKESEPLQAALYAEILGRIKQTDLTVPVRDGKYFHYSRTQEGQQYRIHCRKLGSLEAAEEVVLDLNQLAVGKPYLGLGAYEFSDDDRYVAYSVDPSGFRDYTLALLDTKTGKLGSESRERVSSIAWAADGKTLFYVITDHAKRPYRLYRHQLGASHEDDTLVFEEKDERFNLYVYRSRSQKYLFVASASHTTSEFRFFAADKPNDKLRVIAARAADHEYTVDHRDKHFYIRTNDKGRNFRLVSAPIATPGPEHWKELVPHSDQVMLASVDIFRDFYALEEREDGLPHIRVTSFGKGGTRRIPMPEAVYAAFTGGNPEFGTGVLRYEYTSPTTPPSVLEYDVAANTSKLLKETEVLGGYDRTQYQAERAYATAADGTRIPISLVAKKGSPRPAPMLLIGYGAYGASYDVGFEPGQISLLDRGVTVAIAHIRGGGELGKRWHDAGRMLNKKNTFSDFVSAAEFLVNDRRTAPDKLIIQGASAGGLLMGAVVNLRPDLFKAVVTKVPFVDVVTTMLDDDLPLTVGEFEEWGNPKDRTFYGYMKEYCPYTNLKQTAYPAMLVKTSYNDSQVMYWEPAKYVAKLRTLKTDEHPLLLKTNMGAGHGGASGRYDRIREQAFDYAFMLSQWGIR